MYYLCTPRSASRFQHGILSHRVPYGTSLNLGARIAPGARRTGNVGTLRALGVPYGTSLNGSSYSTALYPTHCLFINLLCLQKKQAVLSPVRVCRITVRRLLFSGGTIVLILYTAAYQFANLVRVFRNHCVKRYGKRREYVISAHILHKRQPVFCFGAGL